MIAGEELGDPLSLAEASARRSTSRSPRPTMSCSSCAASPARRPVRRLGLAWPGHAEQRVTGLGARHGLHVDQAGRSVWLGADRRYTGPDCPPDMLDQGGIPQGDYAPVPWALSSRGWAAWLETVGHGARFDARRRGRALGARGRRAAAAAPVLREHARPRGCAPSCARRARSRRCCPSGPTGTGSHATSTSTSATSRPTSRATRNTTFRSTRSSSTRRGRRSTTPGSSTPTSSPTRRA